MGAGQVFADHRAFGGDAFQQGPVPRRVGDVRAGAEHGQGRTPCIEGGAMRGGIDAGRQAAGHAQAGPGQRGGERRVIWSEFLGRAAPFPQGPFVLAAALRCPVLLMFALRQQGKLRIHCEAFADPLLLPRAQRQQALQQAVDRYAARLAHYALLAPLDWFNFFDFWTLPDSQTCHKESDHA